MHFPLFLSLTSFIETPMLSHPFPNQSLFLLVCNTSLLESLREKEKLLVESNFSFSHGVFYPFGKLSRPLFSRNLKWSSANSFSLKASKICFVNGKRLEIYMCSRHQFNFYRINNIAFLFYSYTVNRVSPDFLYIKKSCEADRKKVGYIHDSLM